MTDQADVSFTSLSAAEAARRIREGALDAVTLAEHCLARHRQVESAVEAFTFLDPDLVMAQADMADRARQAGRPMGPLHGVPVAIKDILDTFDMPTECGTALFAGRRPEADATAVRNLRKAGAVIFGKTVTTECAYFHPGKTKNPHDPNRTPGGSSSGSAAAVAAYTVPMAVGTQTNGSVIRPASFCGVVGFKPTHGLISRANVLALSRSLDQIGVFTRTVEDAALMAEAMIGHDPEDPDTRLQSHAGFQSVACSEPPMEPKIGFLRTPKWDMADADCREGLEELAGALGGRCEEITLDDNFADAWKWHEIVMQVEMAHNLAKAYDRGRDRISAPLAQLIEAGRGRSAVEYVKAREQVAVLNFLLEEVYRDFDAILCRR